MSALERDALRAEALELLKVRDRVDFKPRALQTLSASYRRLDSQGREAFCQALDRLLLARQLRR